METKLGFFTGSSMGYWIGKFFGGSQTGQPGIMGPLLLDLGNLQLHLHHWLISFACLIFTFLFLRKRQNLSPVFFSFFVGVLSGLIFQGIFYYDDWHKILIKS